MTRGPIPKPAHLVQGHRRVKSIRLEPVGDAPRRTPRLPTIEGVVWHKETRSWWRNVWKSPMAAQYSDVDFHGLERLAILIDQYYREPNVKLLSEIRLQEQRFGLDPVSRARLRWELDQAPEPGREPPILEQLWGGKDPRSALKSDDKGGDSSA